MQTEERIAELSTILDTGALKVQRSIPILTVPDLGEVGLVTWLPAVFRNVKEIVGETEELITKEESIQLRQIIETVGKVQQAWRNVNALNFAVGKVNMHDYTYIDDVFTLVFNTAFKPIQRRDIKYLVQKV